MRLALIFAVAAIASTAVAGDDDAETAPLVAAVADASDPVAIARAARRLSGRQLVEMIGLSRPETRAVVYAAHFSDESVEMLSRLADVAGGYDRSLAVPAARAAREIVGALDRETAAEREVPRRLLAEAAVAWHRVARDRSLWADVRIAALEVSRDLTRQLTGDGTRTAVELVADPDVEIRRAALELLDSPLPAERIERVVDRLMNDSEPEVAVAAAAALCSGGRFGDDLAAVRRAAGERGLARIAELAADKALSAAARFAAAGCVTDAGARAAIAATLPPALRRQLESP